MRISLLSNGILTFIFKLISSILAVLVSMFCGRFFGIEILGKYNFALTLISLLVVLCSLGGDQLIVRFFSKSSGHCSSYNNSVLFSALTIRLSLFIIVVIAIGVGSNYVYETSSLADVSLLLSLILLFCLFNSGFQYALQGLFKAQYSVFSLELLPNLIKLSFLTIIIIFGLADNSLITLIRVHLVSLIIGAGVAFIMYTNLNRIRRFRLKLVVMKRLVQDGAPLLIASSAWLVMLYSDIIVLGIVSSDVDVGGYSVAQRIATLITILLSSVNAVIAPKISNYYSNGNREGLERIVKLSTFFLTLSGFSFLIIASFLSKEILGFWGGGFVSFYPVLIVLLFGQFINAATGSVGTVLVMTGRQKIMRNVAIFASIINIVLNLILIPLYGAVGAAIATTFSLSLLNILYMVFVARELNILSFDVMFGLREVRAMLRARLG